MCESHRAIERTGKTVVAPIRRGKEGEFLGNKPRQISSPSKSEQASHNAALSEARKPRVSAAHVNTHNVDAASAITTPLDETHDKLLDVLEAIRGEEGEQGKNKAWKQDQIKKLAEATGLTLTPHEQVDARRATGKVIDAVRQKLLEVEIATGNKASLPQFLIRN